MKLNAFFLSSYLLHTKYFLQKQNHREGEMGGWRGGGKRKEHDKGPTNMYFIVQLQLKWMFLFGHCCCIFYRNEDFSQALTRIALVPLIDWAGILTTLYSKLHFTYNSYISDIGNEFKKRLCFNSYCRCAHDDARLIFETNFSLSSYFDLSSDEEFILM